MLYKPIAVTIEKNRIPTTLYVIAGIIVQIASKNMPAATINNTYNTSNNLLNKLLVFI